MWILLSDTSNGVVNLFNQQLFLCFQSSGRAYLSCVKSIKTPRVFKFLPIVRYKLYKDTFRCIYGLSRPIASEGPQGYTSHFAYSSVT